MQTRKRRGGSPGQRGGSLANLFRKKKAPLASQTNTVQVKTGNNTISYKRAQSQANFITMKKKKAMVAKMLRNHVAKLKSVSNNVRKDSIMLMNDTLREKTQILMNYPNINSLSNDQLVELYTTGKVRSKSE